MHKLIHIRSGHTQKTQPSNLPNTIHEKRTMKATEHDKYKHIADSVRWGPFMGSNRKAYYCLRRLASGCVQLNKNIDILYKRKIIKIYNQFQN